MTLPNAQGLLPFAAPATRSRGEMTSTSTDLPTSQLTFAVPKGRILDEALPVMARAGVVPEDGFFDKANRSLSFATTREDDVLFS